MASKDQAIVFVRDQLSWEHPKLISELYQSGRQHDEAIGESSIRRAVWLLVSRGEVSIDSHMRLRTAPHAR